MDNLLSRRRLLFSGAAATAASVSLIAAGASASEQPNPETSRPELISPGDSRFHDVLEARYPGLESDSGFFGIRPLSCILYQRDGRGILAFSISWTLTTAKTSYTEVLQFQSRPGQRYKASKKRSASSGSMILVRGKEIRLVTPYFSWSPEHYEKKKPIEWKAVYRNREPHRFLVSEVASGATVTSRIDSVVYDDFTNWGPNQRNYIARYAVQRNAEHDEALAVQRLLASKPTAAEVQNLLSKHIEKARPNDEQNLLWYANGRKSYANYLSSRLSTIGIDRFSKEIAVVAKQAKLAVPTVHAM